MVFGTGRKGQGPILEEGGLNIVRVVLLIIALILVVIPFIGAVDKLNQQRVTEGSAVNITNAVEEVWKCANSVEEGGSTADCETEVTVTLDQEDPGASSEDDPQWITYWKRNPNKPNDCPAGEEFYSALPFTGNDCTNEREDEGISVTALEYDLGKIAQYCGRPRSGKDDPSARKGTCYGFVGRSGLPSKKFTPAVKGERYEDVKNFWLISPCYTKLKVYWDADDQRVEMKIPPEEESNLKPDSAKYNFCCGNNEVEGWKEFGGSVDSDWPENGAFNDGDGEDEGAPKKEGEFCDFMNPANE